MKKNTDLAVFYDFLTNNVSIGIHAINTAGQTIIYNEKMKSIEGLDFEELADHSIVDIFRFNQAENSTLLQVLKTQQPINQLKQTYWNQNGHEITTINDTYPIFENGKLIGAIEFSRDITTLEKIMHRPLQHYGEPMTFEMLTAASKQMTQVIQTAKISSQVQVPIILIGESGTGKDLIAEAIHYETKPLLHDFITIYCNHSDNRMFDKLQIKLDSLPRSTFFFERIEYLTIQQQQTLFSLLTSHSQNHLFIASVGNDPIHLIATDLLLKELYYFFATMSITIPPLRERTDDLLPFMNDYLIRYRKKYGSRLKDISEEVNQVFQNYKWPGNLKELELLLEEIAALTTTETTITYTMLPHHFKLKLQENPQQAEDFVLSTEQDFIPLDHYLQQAESYYLSKALDKYEHNITKAAQALGMSRQNLQYRLRKMKKNNEKEEDIF